MVKSSPNAPESGAVKGSMEWAAAPATIARASSVSKREASRWAHFVARELRDPGPAFEILYAGLWRPGVEITARLIARILGIPESDPAARIRALLLISSLLAFQSGRSISLRTMQWTSIGPPELAMVLSGVEAQIDAIGHGG